MLLLILFILGMSIYATEVVLDGLVYRVKLEEEKEASVFNKSATGDIVVRSTVDIDGVTYTVTSTEEYSFQEDSITSVVLPPTIVDIGRASFGGCNKLKSVDIQGNVRTIKNITFNRCTSLENITLPASVRKIELYAFGNSGLKSIIIPSNCTSVEKFAFFDCKDLAEVTFQGQITSLEESVFQDCSALKELLLPESVTSFKKNALKGCKLLSSINIPKSLAVIENGAFDLYNCDSLSTVELHPENTNFVLDEDVLYNSDKTEIVLCLRSKVGEYIIPESITSLKDSEFADCIKLTSILIPSTLTKLGKYVFHRCLGLKYAEIPDQVVEIGYGIFNSCENLEEAKLPTNMTILPTTTFLNCHSLRTITIPNGVTSIGPDAFCQCYNLTSIVIPPNVKEIHHAAFARTGLENVVIPESVEKFGDTIFGDCFFLKTIDLPSSLTEIGNHCFQNCWRMSKITCRATNPPGKANDFTFKHIDKSICVLEVPVGSKALYQQDEYWATFTNITEVNFQSSVPSFKEQGIKVTTGKEWIKVELVRMSEVIIYTMNGMRVVKEKLPIGEHQFSLPTGTYILNIHGASEKIIVK